MTLFVGLLAVFMLRPGLEDRINTQGVIKELASTSTGRAPDRRRFFDVSHAGMSHIMYNLILDADIKDTALIVALAQRERQESSPAIRQRLIDLISDASTNTALSYSDEINDFLTRAAMDPAPEINQAAKVRHAGIPPGSVKRLNPFWRIICWILQPRSGAKSMRSFKAQDSSTTMDSIQSLSLHSNRYLKPTICASHPQNRHPFSSY
ncbi:MAG: hypothetical protein IPM37_07555 [Hahellaceae bacterium]|nr:hypothetical protein [Hahellaceae bacterium]